MAKKPTPKKYTILKSFCYKNAKGDPVYVPRYAKCELGYVRDKLGQKSPNTTTLPKEALLVAKKVNAI